MKCEVTSKTTHEVMISTEIMVPSSYKDICRGEPKKVNIGFNNDPLFMWVENNSLTPNVPTKKLPHTQASIADTWEVLPMFFSLHNIEPNWLNCHFSWGRYNPDLGGWTGCTGNV